MSHPRYHVTVGHRSPRARKLAAEVQLIEATSASGRHELVALSRSEPGPLIYRNYVEIAPDTWVRADHVTLVEPNPGDDPEHGSGTRSRVWVAGTERWSSPYTPAQVLKAIARLSASRKEWP